jgi:streptogramin lyase
MNIKRGLFIAAIILLNFSIVFLLLAEEAGQPSQTVGFMTEFPIPTVNGAPQNLVIEVDGPPTSIWFTMPDADAIGNLVVTDTINFTFTSYPLSTANSEPYDLLYDSANGRIWFTERARAFIGYLTISTGNIVEFAIPNGGLPHSIAIAPNGLIWFTQPEANNLVSFSLTTSNFTAFPYTSAGGAPTKIAITDNDSVWITAPGTNHMAEFETGTSNFIKIPVVDFGSTAVPPSDILLQGTIPWIANPTENRIGRYIPQTLTFFRWFDLPSANTGINSIFMTQPSGELRLWYTEPNNGRAGLMILDNTELDILEHAVHGLPSPTSLPVDIVTDSSGNAWIADNGGQSIVRWAPPYVNKLFLPFVQKP